MLCFPFRKEVFVRGYGRLDLYVLQLAPPAPIVSILYIEMAKDAPDGIGGERGIYLPLPF